MLNQHLLGLQSWNFLGQAEPPPASFAQAQTDLWRYRSRTTALLRRYARASVEVGRLPSLVGREFFRARVTSYAMKNFEDVVIFVTDMEHALDQLAQPDRQLIAMNVLEEYSIPEVSQLFGSSQRTVGRQLQCALDNLSLILLNTGLLEKLIQV
jgi:DNA-directed RNA polymerase specialized sigma24 family protein